MTPQTQRSVRDEMLHAAVGLLNDHGPDALQTRKVASAAGTSTMAVYTHFGGMPGLIAEVADEGMRQFDAALALPHTADPVADLLATGLAYRHYAIERPHMYRLMFGSTSAHGINAPAHNVLTLSIPQIGERYPAFAQFVRSVLRSIEAGRISVEPVDPNAADAAVVATAAQLWSLMHGFVMLELAGFFGTDGSAVTPVLGSLISRELVALGDSPEQVLQSQRLAVGVG
nr:TetR/AcrR family transcriptional regulator [Mycobacterium spongiae]